jgi:hypothetical protein
MLSALTTAGAAIKLATLVRKLRLDAIIIAPYFLQKHTSMIFIKSYIIFRQGAAMRKNISKRRWRARLLMGKWVPGLVLHHYGFYNMPPSEFENHPTADFYRIWLPIWK